MEWCTVIDDVLKSNQNCQNFSRLIFSWFTKPSWVTQQQSSDMLAQKLQIVLSTALTVQFHREYQKWLSSPIKVNIWMIHMIKCSDF